MKISRVDLSGGVAYRGEGNANLVVSLVGSRTILRFPKSKFIDKSQHEKLETIARYVNDVIRPKLAGYVDPVSVTTLDWQQLDAIRSLVNPFRPSDRLGKDIFYPAALVLPDYSFMPEPSRGPVMAVEIKPKLGFMFSKNLVHPTLCNYCLKQYYKKSVGKVKSTSQYCPLDLYSGDMSRMRKAFNALLDSPQNNLRIFKDGELLHNEETVRNPVCESFLNSMLGSANVLPDLVVRALTESPTTNLPATVSSSYLNNPEQQEKQGKHCNKSAHQLPQQCILSSVLDLQKRNILPDSEAQIILNSLLSDGCDLATLQSLVTSSQSVDNLTKAQSEKMKLLKNYLLSVTAKDLSIILTLVEDSPQSSGKSGQQLKIKDKMFKYKWSIVDLDPKNLHRISKYVEQKQMWLKAFEESKINA